MQVNYMQYIYRPDSYLSQRLLSMQFSVISYVTRMHHVTMLPGYHVTLWLIPHLHIYVWYICSIKLLTYLEIITYLLSPYNTNVAYIDTASKK